MSTLNLKEHNAFVKRWDINALKNMTLNEYTEVGSKETFSYEFERKLKDYGSFRGGGANKFGIFAGGDKQPSKNGLITDKTYKWYSKYGNTAKKAFEEIKKEIIHTIGFAQKGSFEDIDKINLGEAYKWKLAFHYQNIKNPFVIPVFKSEALREFLLSTNSSMYKLYSDVQNRYNISSIKEAFKIGTEIWENYQRNFSESERKETTRKSRFDILSAEENLRREKVYLHTKRNSKISKKRKDDDEYTCQNPKCKFKFKNVIVESHHLKPFSMQTTEKVITNIDDLITLCPTCHRLAHFLLKDPSLGCTEKGKLLDELSKIKVNTL